MPPDRQLARLVQARLQRPPLVDHDDRRMGKTAKIRVRKNKVTMDTTFAATTSIFAKRQSFSISGRLTCTELDYRIAVNPSQDQGQSCLCRKSWSVEEADLKF
eukprot:scpid61388/ scgid8938/ 